jgi:hypothetical protein
MYFGAHESFHIREGWLRKGLLGIEKNPYLFSDPYPGDELGVGHNMVSAIRYWLQATRLAKAQTELKDGKKVVRFSRTPLAEVILKHDPYLEEDGTLWVLHYQLATNKDLAPTWYWFFNIFGIRHFTQDLLFGHLQRYVEGELRRKISPRTLEKDFRCLVRTYARSEEKAKRFYDEDTYDCPLASLNLLHVLPLTKAYRLVSPPPEMLHPLLVAYALMEMRLQLPLQPDEVSLRDALYEQGSPGRVYVLDSETLYEHLLRLESEERELLTFSRTAGLNLITFKSKAPMEVLNRYYDGVRALTGVHG